MIASEYGRGVDSQIMHVVKCGAALVDNVDHVWHKMLTES
jgi:hypothetical protein